MTPFQQQIAALAYSVDVVHRDDQTQQTEALVMSIVPQVLESLHALRSAVDKAVQALRAGTTQPEPAIFGVTSLAEYPIGFCRFIRDAVFGRLEHLSLFGELRRQGVIIKPIYIILNDMYFQNAIQVGNLYVDVANDTVDPSKEKIVWERFCGERHRNLDDYDRYLRIAEPYLKVKIYPNLIFPHLFPFLTAFCSRSDGEIVPFVHQEVLLYKDIAEDFRLSEQFLRYSAYCQRPLPEAAVRRLLERIPAPLRARPEFQPRFQSPRQMLKTTIEHLRALRADPIRQQVITSSLMEAAHALATCCEVHSQTPGPARSQGMYTGRC